MIAFSFEIHFKGFMIKVQDLSIIYFVNIYMKKSVICTLLIIYTFLVGCQDKNLLDSSQIEQISDNFPPVNTEIINLTNDFKPVTGQTIYVPVYSHVYFLNQGRIFNLTATINFQNTDPEYPIILKSIKYYDTKGNLLEDYLSNPVKLNPFASTDFYIDQVDIRGGVGANFLIEWVADNQVSEPIAESVMIGASGTQGISFLSQGRVIKEFKPSNSVQN